MSGYEIPGKDGRSNQQTNTRAEQRNERRQRLGSRGGKSHHCRMNEHEQDCCGCGEGDSELCLMPHISTMLCEVHDFKVNRELQDAWQLSKSGDYTHNMGKRADYSSVLAI